MKPKEKVTTSYQDWKESPEYTKYIDRKNKQVKLPNDFKKAISKHGKVREYFYSLSFSHKREFIENIIEAKKPETRAGRIDKIIETLKKKM